MLWFSDKNCNLMLFLLFHTASSFLICFFCLFNKYTIYTQIILWLTVANIPQHFFSSSHFSCYSNHIQMDLTHLNPIDIFFHTIITQSHYHSSLTLIHSSAFTCIHIAHYVYKSKCLKDCNWTQATHLKRKCFLITF